MREPRDYAEDSGTFDVRELRGKKIDPELVELIAKAIARAQPKVSYSNGSKKDLWIGLVATAGLALSAWTLGKLTALGEDVAVIKCQLSAACNKPVFGASNGK